MKKRHLLKTAWLLLAVSSWAFARQISDNQASEHIGVSISLAKAARIQPLEFTDQIRITPGDIKRGYLELPRAYKLSVWCNSPGGVTVEAALKPGLSDSTGRILNGHVSIRPQKRDDLIPVAEIPVPVYEGSGQEKFRVLEYDLRLHLPKNLAPGVYHFDIAFTAQPK